MSRPRFQPLELQISYDSGKTLTFYEIPNTVYGQPSYELQEVVDLQVDFGSGLQTIFSGKIKSRNHVGENNNEGIAYTAIGMHQLADEIAIVNVLGTPEYYIPAAMSPGINTVTYLKTVRQAITDVFTVNSARLAAAGIPTSYSLDGLSDAYVDRDTTLTGGFFAAIQELASFDPGVKAFFDDTDQKWKFVNIFQSPITVIDISSTNVKNHNYEISTQNRFSAIKLVNDGTLNPTTSGNAPTNFATYQIFPSWNADLEATWTRDLGSHPLLSDGETYNPYYDVYRTFVVGYRIQVPYIGDVVVPIEGSVEAPLDGSVQVWFKPFAVVPIYANEYVRDTSSGRRGLVTINNSTYGPAQYRAPLVVDDVFSAYPSYNQLFSRQKLKDSLGFDRLVGVQAGQVILQENGGITIRMSEPLAWGQVDVPGAAMHPVAEDIAPFGVFASWFHSKPITTVPVVTQLFYRYPTTGFTGDAFDIAGLQAEKIIYASAIKMNEQFARRLLDTMSGFLVNMTLPLEGDILSEYVSLNRKVILKDSTRSTGIQSVAIPLVSYTYTFGKTGLSQLALASDTSNLIKT